MDAATLYLSLPKSIREGILDEPGNPPGSPTTWTEMQVLVNAARLVKAPYIMLNTRMADIQGFRRCGFDLCERLQVIPVYSHETLMVFACVTPWEPKIIAEIRQHLHCEVIPLTCPQSNFEVVLAHLKSIEKTSPKEKESHLEITHATDTGWNLGRIEGSQETDLVKSIIRKAFSMGASDIHIEPFEDQLDIRFRIHGEMVVQPPIEQRFAQKVINDLKLLSMMKLGDLNRLKDGRISLPVTTKRKLDLRVAAAPTRFGEAMVLRLLDPASIQAKLGILPFDGKDLELVKFGLTRPSGLFIMTGPTGSGKTTTLYRCLTSLNLSKQKVITIEDPVEYTLNGITQIQVDTENEVTFASSLRSVLRMDPEVIMVGEIRDPETASLAVQAALTGHLVLTTLHTNDAVGVIPRLLDLQVSAQLIRSTLLLVIAQRLLGRLCDECKDERDIDSVKIRHFEKYRISAPKALYSIDNVGCETCNYTGISGMVPIFEFLHATPEIKHAIGIGAPEVDIRNLCDQKGHHQLINHALRLAAEGIVSYEEACTWENDMF